MGTFVIIYLSNYCLSRIPDVHWLELQSGEYLLFKNDIKLNMDADFFFTVKKVCHHCHMGYGCKKGQNVWGLEFLARKSYLKLITLDYRIGL